LTSPENGRKPGYNWQVQDNIRKLAVCNPVLRSRRRGLQQARNEEKNGGVGMYGRSSGMKKRV